MKNIKKIVYGYIDESGTAGVGSDRKEYLVLSLVLLDEVAKNSINVEFAKLRQKLKLRPDYEFHYSKSKVEMREEVFAVMRDIDFKFMTFAIKKDGVKSHASYANMAEKVITAVMEFNCRVEIIIDENPVLYKELNKLKKQNSLKDVRFIQRDSKKEDGLQLVDHVVSGHARIIKGQDEPNFRKIKSKLVRAEVIEFD